MADPKYANLPGIDTQPDVYETNDLAEDDQQRELAELSSESVEKLSINTKEAFNKFQDKMLLSGQVDFSDRISQARRTGYVAPKKEYEILEDGYQDKETPVQRFQRLQHEIRDLGQEVDKLQKTAKEESSGVGVSPATLMQDISVLQQQLYGLHLEKILGNESVIEAADPQGSLPKKLFNQLDAFKKEAGQPSTPPKKGTQETKDGHVTYELYYRPEQNKFTQVSKGAELEQRLNGLEAMLGQDPQKLASLTADSSSKSLMESVSQLQARVAILDVGQVDHIEARIQGLLQRLDQVSEKKSAVEDAGKDSKISALYEMVQKWDSIADTLPKVVDRLQALKDLHEQALQFSQALSQLDIAQQQLTSSMGSQDTLLKQLKESFAANLASIQANCESLESRMKGVKK
ncbi:dynactin subunit 2 [Strongylocentrotus purpuratus]|uniref:Dynactin subunit 2 n=1 Tax=Strongylocentrotus purpuratus TaxID=7668 RepID=A0A7M7P5B4_STRPU|nr:dynactin subunit 2 [Strongylocentrotus purpuratus]